MKRSPIKFTFAFIFLTLASFSNAAENENRVTPIITKPTRVDVILLCPEGSHHEGELVPKWVRGAEATDYFCNGSVEGDTEVIE